jgi:hypothetical protein
MQSDNTIVQENGTWMGAPRWISGRKWEWDL